MLYNNAMHHQTYPAGYGHEYGMPSSGHQIHHQGLVETIQHCESVCEHMITHINETACLPSKPHNCVVIEVQKSL